MKILLIVLGLILVQSFKFNKFSAVNSVMNVYYCGFSGDFCGQSQTDDVYFSADFVTLAWAKVNGNGALVIDEANFPRNQVKKWKDVGKKVLLSVGGSVEIWKRVLASDDTQKAFIESTINIINNFGIQGLDFHFDADYSFSPKQIANLINTLRERLKIIPWNLFFVVTADCVGVYQGAGVPDPDTKGQPYNFVVALYKLADKSINYYQARAYSNWYDGIKEGSLEYLQDVYLHWRNLKSLCPSCIPIPSFPGIAAEKFLIGVLGSTDARQAQSYVSPSTLRAFKDWLKSKGYQLYGFNVWNSYFDSQNGNQITQAIAS